MKKELIEIGGILLPQRDVAMLRFATDGLTNAEIADLTGLAESTVEKFLDTSDPIRSIYDKIGVNKRAQAVAWYIENTTKLEAGISRDEPGSEMPEILERATLFPQQLGVIDLVEIFADQLQTIVQARIEGNPRLTIQRARTTHRRLGRTINKITSSDSRPFKPLLRIQGLVLVEEATALSEIALPREVLGATQSVVASIQSIAKQCNDEELSGLGDQRLAEAHYIAGQYQSSIELLSNALGKLSKTSDQLLSLRTLSLNWAYEKSSYDFKDVEARARSLILETPSSEAQAEVCQLLEGLGRGQGLLGRPEALKTLEEGWAVNSKIEGGNKRIPINAVQLIRSEVEAMRYLQPLDKRLLEERGLYGINQAKDNYQRHAKLIENLLKEALD